jgi:surfeit locus 1 family protein
MPLSRPARARLVLAATIAGVAITANLGAWQLRRAAQKVALQEAIESRAATAPLTGADIAMTAGLAEAQHFRPVRLRGNWVGERSVYLENRQMAGRVGFELLTPLRLEGSAGAVLVQRGWLPRDLRDRTLLPPVRTPAGSVEVVGHIAPAPARLYELGASGVGLIRQNLDLDSFGLETGLRFASVTVRQADSPGTAGDGLRRDWPRPAVDVQKHYGYAFQWFALGALMAGLYVWFQLVRPRLRRDARA